MKKPAFITLEDSLWPLVIARVVGTPSLSDLEGYLTRRAKHLRRGPHVQVVDATRIVMLPAEARQRILEWLPPHEELIRERLLGTAYATDSAFLRLTLSILFHLRPQTSPHIIVSRLDVATEWAARRLEEEGLHEGAELTRHHFGLLPRMGLPVNSALSP
jgi:hypothetical protein